MTRRLLPPEEWPRLAATPQLGDVWAQLPPSALVVVVEEGDQIIATWAVMPIVHVEGAWIHGAYPRAAVPLLRGMREAAHALGATDEVWTGASDPATEVLLLRMAASRVPFESFLLPLAASLKGES